MADQEAIPQVADLNQSDVVECVVVFRNGTERRYAMDIAEVNRLAAIRKQKSSGAVTLDVDQAQAVTFDLADVLVIELGKKLRDAPEAFRRKSE
jgi:hypothetical protein